MISTKTATRFLPIEPKPEYSFRTSAGTLWVICELWMGITPKEATMRKIVVSLAALAALSFALPYAAPAKADIVVVHRHHHHHWSHPQHQTVIIKHDHD
jgi:hypothetical protein